jgi:hypothetical protein
MSYRRSLIGFVFLIILGGLGFLVLGAAQAGAQDCVLTIEKAAIPANDFPFDFLVTGNGSEGFTLFDPSDNTINIGMSVGNIFTVTEDVPAGWSLDNIECVEGVTDCGPPGEFIPCLDVTIIEGGIIAECLDNDAASCTFTNSFTGTVIPTLSEWGLIAMAAVIGAAGIFMALRRRKAEA